MGLVPVLSKKGFSEIVATMFEAFFFFDETKSKTM